MPFKKRYTATSLVAQRIITMRQAYQMQRLVNDITRCINRNTLEHFPRTPTKTYKREIQAVGGSLFVLGVSRNLTGEMVCFLQMHPRPRTELLRVTLEFPLAVITETQWINMVPRAKRPLTVTYRCNRETLHTSWQEFMHRMPKEYAMVYGMLNQMYGFLIGLHADRRHAEVY